MKAKAGELIDLEPLASPKITEYADCTCKDERSITFSNCAKLQCSTSQSYFLIRKIVLNPAFKKSVIESRTDSISCQRVCKVVDALYDSKVNVETGTDSFDPGRRIPSRKF